MVQFSDENKIILGTGRQGTASTSPHPQDKENGWTYTVYMYIYVYGWIDLRSTNHARFPQTPWAGTSCRLMK